MKDLQAKGRPMFFRNLQMKEGVTLDVTLCEARLPVHMGHRDAREVFGEPLARQLAAAGLGTVMKVKAHESAPDDICGVTLFLGLTRADRSALESVGRMLEHLHAPFGSSVRVTAGRGAPHVFGLAEGVEVTIDTDTAPEPGHRRDFAKACATAMKGFAISRGWVKRGGQTVFYFYGDNVFRMQETLSRMFEEGQRFPRARTRRLA